MEGVSLLEILILEGVSLLEILIWVQYKGMWIKNLPYMSYYRTPNYLFSIIIANMNVK